MRQDLNLKQQKTADLLAIMAKADGIVLNIENDNARKMLDCFRIDMLNEFVKEPFDLAEFNAKAMDSEYFRSLPYERRAEIIGLLWYMAICDGDLHLEEEKLFYEMVDRCGFSRKDAIRTQKVVEGLLAQGKAA